MCNFNSTFSFETSILFQNKSYYTEISDKISTGSSIICSSTIDRSIDLDEVNRFNSKELINWDMVRKITFESKTKLRKILGSSRQQNYLQITLNQHYYFSSDKFGSINISLEDFDYKCNYFGNQKLFKDGHELRLIYLLRVHNTKSGDADIKTEEIKYNVLKSIPPIFIGENSQIVYTKNNDDNQEIDEVYDEVEIVNKEKTINKKAPKNYREAVQMMQSKKTNAKSKMNNNKSDIERKPKQKSLNYNQVLNVYSQTVNVAILEDIYNPSLVYCMSVLGKTIDNLQEEMEIQTEDYEKYKYLNGKYQFVCKFKSFIEQKFQNQQLTLDEYKTNVENAKTLNSVVIKFYTDLNKQYEVKILQERIGMIENELANL